MGNSDDHKHEKNDSAKMFQIKDYDRGIVSSLKFTPKWRLQI